MMDGRNDWWEEYLAGSRGFLEKFPAIESHRCKMSLSDDDAEYADDDIS